MGLFEENDDMDRHDELWIGFINKSHAEVSLAPVLECAGLRALQP